MNQRIHKDIHQNSIPSLTKVGQYDTTIKEIRMHAKYKESHVFLCKTEPLALMHKKDLHGTCNLKHAP